MDDFESSMDKVLMGAERRSMIISDVESGPQHTTRQGMLWWHGSYRDPVHKVTIIPRGRALGVTQQLPSEDRLSMTKSLLKIESPF